MMTKTLPTTSPNAITILRACGMQGSMHCAKKFVRQDDGKIVVQPYGNVLNWTVETRPADNLDSLVSSLTEISAQRDCIVIGGCLRNEDDPRARAGGAGVFRRYLDKPERPADFSPCARRWVAIDIDKLQAPNDCASFSSERMAAWARGQLPTIFTKAACWYQWTSSYRVLSGPLTLNLRLWFLTDAALTQQEWKAYWKVHATGYPFVDTAVYSPVQPVYTALPVFKGVQAPFPVSERHGGIAGEPRVKIAHIHSKLKAHAERLAATPELEYDPSVIANPEEIQQTIDRLLTQKTVGSRHNHAVGACCELIGLGCPADRLLEVAGHIIAEQGREPRPEEAADIVRWAVDKLKTGSLTTNNKPIATILEPVDEDAEDADVGLDDQTEGMLTGYGPNAYHNAQVFMQRNYPTGGLMRWSQTDWEWVGTHWNPMETDALPARICRDAHMSAGKAKSIADTIRSLRMQEAIKLPCWLDRPDAEVSPMAVFANGMVCLEDLIFDDQPKVLPHDQNFFNAFVLPYEYDAKATCPHWEAFLDDCFATQEEKRECAKMFGYLLQQRNDLQKFFILQGAPRAGKGVMMSVIKHLVGPRNCAWPQLSSLADEFALQPLVGKPVILVDEAHTGMRASNGERVVDLLKTVTGGSPVQVNRKNKEHLQDVYLPGRFILACNRLPNFIDPSGALSARLVPLIFAKSFVGKEDPGLAARLTKELPGIFNWAVQGMRWLMTDQRFNLQDSACDILEATKRASAPVYAFRCDALALDSHGFILKDELYRAYRNWCAENQNRPLAKNRFGAEICQLLPGLSTIQSRQLDNKRAFMGLRFTEMGHTLLKSIPNMEDDSSLDELM